MVITLLLEYYLEQLDYVNMPSFLVKYLSSPSLLRLKNVGYFCGMDYASKEIYNFKENITRYDHSLTVSLIVYRLTNDIRATLAGLFHDIATPCFSHVVDYMNQDYEKQESTEEYTEEILRSDEYLNRCLMEDGIAISDIVNFKRYPIVDNDRPRLCADRLDGIILTGIGWTKNIDYSDIKNIVDDMVIFKNEDGIDEIGFKSFDVAKKVLEVSDSINVYCHSVEDNYMMQLLARITKLAIDRRYIDYSELYILNEKDLFSLLKEQDYMELRLLIYEFENKKVDEVPKIDMPYVKNRTLNPLVNKKRIN